MNPGYCFRGRLALELATVVTATGQPPVLTVAGLLPL